MEQVAHTGEELTIAKNGTPVAKLMAAGHRRDKPHVIDAARVWSEHRLRENWTLARSVGAAWVAG